ncbi:Blastula protease 10-like 4 [Homarus americanus]|uniref:Metalloendopeptidase n=1 Tax=Homarus americanus TaxID=6706 RepID=A0A8J5MZV3_HOMAM|nr:Blastula protease 10-like 4 [Homarus americanus]
MSLYQDQEEVSPALKMNANIGFEFTNPDTVNGKELFEKDLMLTPEQWHAIRERKAISNVIFRWPPGPNGYPLIPYRFVDPVNRQAVEDGIKHWMEHTCITFEETFNTNQPHLQLIQGSGCWSYVGRVYYWNGQDLSLPPSCTGFGVVVHEIGHAIGFWHEQSRLDRDNHVLVILDNILETRQSNFNKLNNANAYGVPYDYTSVMHYGDTYFTKNGNLTIATTNPLYQELIGQRGGLSHYDKLLANLIYNCTDMWMSNCGLRSDPCENYGYIGADCRCVCPSGTSGDNCTLVTSDYYDDKFSSCTEVITQPGTITSHPDYPDNYEAGLRCTKVIKAPVCFLPVVTFNNFLIYGPLSNGQCYWDFLLIRTFNLSAGEMYCGSQISPGVSFTSTVDEMSLYFSTRTRLYNGWSANVTFVPIDGCW